MEPFTEIYADGGSGFKGKGTEALETENSVLGDQGKRKSQVRGYLETME